MPTQFSAPHWMAHGATTSISWRLCVGVRLRGSFSSPNAFTNAQDTLFFHRLFYVQKVDTAQELTDSRNPGLNKSLNARAWSACGVLPVIPPPTNAVVHDQPATRWHDHL
ncbi:hypothetical protein [Paraburkholderia sediminicola]|uniref:hypothetical protein n=1 Tax=Paraburkholderia sediminicola TaxID=458836 RepID=UPI0038B864FE